MSATRHVLPSKSIVGDHVRNRAGEDLGRIEELVIDFHDGRVVYAVLSFGGVLGFGEKLFAIPWNAIQIDPDDNEIVLNVKREKLQSAPGFDKEDWPQLTDDDWAERVHNHYGYVPYWEESPPQQRPAVREGIRKD